MVTTIDCCASGGKTSFFTFLGCGDADGDGDGDGDDDGLS